MKYKQIADRYRTQILTGQLKAGDRLFRTIRDVTDADGTPVSQATASAAMDILTAEGLIESRRGVGTHVVYRAALSAPPQHVTEVLGDTNPALRRTRCITRDGETVAASISWVRAEAAEIVPEVNSLTDRMPGGWQAIYTTRTGTPLTCRLHSKEDATIDQEAAQVLNVEAGERGYTEVVCTWTTDDGTVLEVRVDTYKPGVTV
ncbi:GntR family transcriptional regulator [Streptomyces sp. NPDC000927]|uniref:GntR family transcriptional regulator n=1 Tax=Streptomyces sp. NPDC000927 TaxID=3154371 RepID=UPI00332E42F8